MVDRVWLICLYTPTLNSELLSIVSTIHSLKKARVTYVCNVSFGFGLTHTDKALYTVLHKFHEITKPQAYYWVGTPTHNLCQCHSKAAHWDCPVLLILLSLKSRLHFLVIVWKFDNFPDIKFCLFMGCKFLLFLYKVTSVLALQLFSSVVKLSSCR